MTVTQWMEPSFDIHVDESGRYLDIPASLPEETRQAIAESKSELLFRLAEREKAEIIRQIDAVRSAVDGGAAERIVDYDSLLDRLSVLERVISGFEQSGLSRWYREGWCMVRSELLNATIIVIRDDGVKLPDGANGFPVYQFTEVEALSDADPETVKQAHGVKRAFNGTVDGAKTPTTSRKSIVRNPRRKEVPA